ncbi:MAG: sensor histidine kinase [Gemmatimonadetes bacterium]|nr:sensor histidine kinase [Gemmatimonadota bacterium]
MLPDATSPAVVELDAALLQAVITLCLAGLCAGLFRRYRKPFLGWFAIAWLLYLLRIAAIVTFLATADRVWLYWHQVATGWTALALLWAALVFSRAVPWRNRYALAMLFPVAWSYVAIYRLDNFFLAAGPAVLFLSVVTLGTGWVFLAWYRRVGSGGAAVLGVALMLWGLHHLDYPFLRARGAWNPWGYYLDILFMLVTGAGILVLLLDDLRLGLGALLTLSGDLQRDPGVDDLDRLLARPLALPTVKGSVLYAIEDGRVAMLRGAGACASWTGELGAAEAAEVTQAITRGEPSVGAAWHAPGPGRGGRAFDFVAVLPVFLEARVTRALVVVGDARDPFAALDTGFLVALGQQVGAALRNAELYRALTARTGDLERLSRRMVQQHEEERRRLSLYLHDETAQLLTAVKLQLGVMQERAEPRLREQLGEMLGQMDDGLRSLRNLTNDLRPALLDDLGLLPALRSLASEVGGQTGLAVRVDAPDALPPLSSDAELALFRALQESLSNVAQHAGAHGVRVSVAAGDLAVTLDVVDDGCGFPSRGSTDGLERAGHLGLAGMRERIVALGGTLATSNAPGGGARVSVRLPVSGA